MHKTSPHTKTIFKLNGERITRHYSAESINKVTLNNKTTCVAVGLLFDLTLKGSTNNHLRFDLNFNKRYLLNEKIAAKTQLNTVEKIALKVASINDYLSIEVSKNFKLVRILNTTQIRNHWETIREDILKEFNNIETLVTSLDTQLQEENIQQYFQNDLFFNHFFCDIYYYDFNLKNKITARKLLTNAVDNITLPIIETKEITQQNRDFSKVILKSNAEIELTNKNFDIKALNDFTGHLTKNTEKQYDMDFNYKGKYAVEPLIGLVTQAQLNYDITISDLYKKTTTINFKLENNE